MVSQYAKFAAMALAVSAQVALAQDKSGPTDSKVSPPTTMPEMPVGIDAGGIVAADALRERVNPCKAVAEACREKYKTLPECAADTATTFQIDLNACKCPTCKQPDSKEEDSRKACTLDAVESCREMLSADATQVCPDKEAFKTAFDKTTCCSTCRPPVPPVAEKPDGEGNCTLAQVKACADNVPVCVDGEERQRIDGQCCGTCSRPKLSCTLEQIASCAATLPECAEGQLPRFDKVSCCGVCKPARPACGTKCPDGEKCIGGLSKFKAISPGFEVPQCVASKAVKKALNFIAGSKMAKFMATANCEEVGTVVKEMVFRYCDKPQNVERCAAVLPAIEGLDIKCGELTPGAANEVTSINIDIEVPTLDASKIRTMIKERIKKTRDLIDEPAVMPPPVTQPAVPDVNTPNTPSVQQPAAPDVNTPSVAPTASGVRRLLEADVTTEVIVNEALADADSQEDGVTATTTAVDYDNSSAATMAPQIAVAIASVIALLW